jgi:phosphoadenosine phosphosulfate reductase
MGAPDRETSQAQPASLAAASLELAGADADQVLRWAEGRFGSAAAIACSFGVEDVVLIDLAASVAPRLGLFTLDTGRLPPETYEVMEQVRQRYAIRIETFFPDRAGVEELEREKGFFSFRNSVPDRKECCAIRKLEPLGRALRGKQAWITGLRREQSVTRLDLEVVEIDSMHGGILKLNPLLGWTEAEVWRYARSRELPVNALHARGYRSIGCAPCTRATEAGEDVRAGRWWWEEPEHKECGLHPRRAGGQ